MCLLGIDYGEKNIGLAISDTRKIISSSLKTIQKTRTAVYINELKAICLERNVGGID